MSPGKCASQAGHAFLESFSKADPKTAQEYLDDGHGTKIVLVAPDEVTLRHTAALAEAAALPHSLIIDEGHIMPPHFDGRPIVTALGIGPATRAQMGKITKEFRLME